MAKNDKNQIVAPTAAPVDDDMTDWQGKFGGSVDGWWAPDGDGPHVMKGVLVNFIDKGRSDKLQSNSLVFELLEPCNNVKNGGSEKMPGQKGDIKTAPTGCQVAVPEWKQLEGLWPSKAGHKVFITRSAEKRSVGKGHSMYDIGIQTSKAAVRHVEVYEAEAPDGDGGGMAPEERFRTEEAAS